MTTTLRSDPSIGFPSTVIRSCSGSTFVPSTRATLPLTLTRPPVISFSAWRRDATPAFASNTWRRTAVISVDLVGLVEAVAFTVGRRLRRLCARLLRFFDRFAFDREIRDPAHAIRLEHRLIE